MSPDGERVVTATYDGVHTDLFVQRIGGRTKQITDTSDSN